MFDTAGEGGGSLLAADDVAVDVVAGAGKKLRFCGLDTVVMPKNGKIGKLVVEVCDEWDNSIGVNNKYEGIDILLQPDVYT